LHLGQLMQVSLVAQRFPLGLPRLILEATAYRRQVQFTEILVQLFFEVGRGSAHCSTSAVPPSNSSKVASETGDTLTAVAGGSAVSSLISVRMVSAFSLPSPSSPSSSRWRSASSTRASPSLAATSRISRYLLLARMGAVSRSASHAMRKRLVGNRSSR